MRNLVLGSDGFIGKPLCRYLKSLGEETLEVDITRAWKFQDLRHARLDIPSVDRVYFLAWDVGGAKYLYDEHNQLRQIKQNTALLHNLMPQLMDIPFVFTSSQLANDPNLPYGVMKRLGELWTQQSEHGISVRLWNVYGEMEEEGIRSHVVSDFIRQARKGKIHMLTDGSEFRWFAHMDDVCKALHHAFEVDGKGPYDVSHERGIRIAQLAHILSSLTGCAVEHEEKSVPERPRGQWCAMLPGWKAEISLEDGLKRMIECGT